VKRLATILLLGALAASLSRATPAAAQAVPSPWVPSACAAFSPRGDLARVDLSRRGLSLHLSLQSGEEQSIKLRLPKDQWEEDCHVFFSEGGQFLAIATRPQPASNSLPEAAASRIPDTLQVRVWDLTKRKWRSTFRLVIRAAPGGAIALEGFGEGKDRLVVGGIAGPDPKGPGQLRMVTLDGSLVPGWKETDDDPIDIRRGIKWEVADSRGCLRRPVALLDRPASKVGRKEVTLAPIQGEWCTVVEPARFPLPGVLAGSTTAHENRVWVWTAGPGPKRSAKILLPPPKRGFLASWNEAYATIMNSPDGRVLAAHRVVTDWVFDLPHAWEDAWILQTNPLRILKRIRSGGCKDLRALAVGDPDGQVHVVTNWCGHWKMQTLAGGPASVQ
jgi:hypothetical protein